MRSFIRDRLPIVATPGIPEIRLHRADRTSGLSHLPELDPGASASPYWAWPWAGGLALARYVLDQPQTVAGRRVLDLGAGSGLVGIAAAMAGASEVFASDTDPNAFAALDLNAALNGAALTPIAGDLMSGAPPPIDLVLVGDLFYERRLAARLTSFLDHCLEAGADVLVGDPYRAFLPRQRLRPLRDYAVSDFGDGGFATDTRSAVFAFERAQAQV